ncbi:hypothetical protein JRQ81_005631 [Phrynocephalus forsythii]|uniref:Uncharacterized protein n=1 Tax=Phrynocephalus forsythii TaxID=171643 RepID=A0A9Q0Y466_9SAUR|nr:hypothetical protein JRQ81_005631 [Phrynocephalus forsythii]
MPKYMCCRNHSMLSLPKSRKSGCPFKDSTCEKCTLTNSTAVGHGCPGQTVPPAGQGALQEPRPGFLVDPASRNPSTYPPTHGITDPGILPVKGGYNS